MKIRFPNTNEATGKNLDPAGSGVRSPLEYTRSKAFAPTKISEDQHAADEMRGPRRTNHRFDPYARPRPLNAALHSEYPTNIVAANSFRVCKLFDQIKAMLPADPARYDSPRLLQFQVDGQPYELRVSDSGTFMIDQLNPTSMMYSMMIEPTGAVAGIGNFPGGQENLARFLTSISARLQYLTS